MKYITTSLWPNQQHACDILKNKRRFLLGDSTGAGKTLSVLAAFSCQKDKRPDATLVVLCNKNAVGTWKDEIPKHTSFTHDVFPTTRKDEDIPAYALDKDVYVFQYSSFQKFPHIIERLFDGQVVLVLEEAHYCKNPKMKKYEPISDLVGRSVVTWAMTATPQINHLTDLYGIINLLAPGVLGSMWDFQNTFLVRKQMKKRDGRKYWVVEDHQNLPLLKKILEPLLYKRPTNYDVEFFYHSAEMGDDEHETYLDAAEGIFGMEDDTYRQFVGRLPDLQRVVDNCITPDRKPNLSPELGTKEAIFFEQVIKQLAANQALLIYVDFLDTMRRLEFILRYAKENYGMDWNRLHTIDGSKSISKREEVQSQFGPKDIIITTRAGKESINLQGGRLVWLYDIPFSIGDVLQIVGRVTRQDSDFNKFEVHVPLVDGTIDVYKKRLLEYNSDVFREMLCNESALPPSPKLSSGGKGKKREIVALRKDLLWKVEARKERDSENAQGGKFEF